MNDNNLIPLNKRTPEERRNIAIAGGIASGESRRESKRMLNALNWGLQRKSRIRSEMTVEESVIECVTQGGENDAEIGLKLIELHAKLSGEMVNKTEMDVSGNIPAVLTEEMIITDDVEEKPKKSKRGK